MSADTGVRVEMVTTDLLNARNFVSLFAGLLIGSLISLHSFPAAPVRGTSLIAAAIRFNLDHFILDNTIGTACLFLWLITRRREQLEAMMVCGALGCVIATAPMKAIT